MKLTHGSMEELQWRNRASTNWLSCISPKQTPETLSLSSRATMAEPGFNGLRAPKSKRWRKRKDQISGSTSLKM
ncbi:hypothetical protein ACFX12_032537 [Malus domestica]